MRLVEGLLGSTRFRALQNTVKTMGKMNSTELNSTSSENHGQKVTKSLISTFLTVIKNL